MSTGPLSILLGPFRIFSKIRGDIREWMFISGVNDTGEKREKFWNKIFIYLFIFIFIGGVVDTGEQFFGGVVDTGEKF